MKLNELFDELYELRSPIDATDHTLWISPEGQIWSLKDTEINQYSNDGESSDAEEYMKNYDINSFEQPAVTHGTWMVYNWEKLFNEPFDKHDPYNDPIKKGWLRIRNHGFQFNINSTHIAAQKLFKYWWPVVIEKMKTEQEPIVYIDQISDDQMDRNSLVFRLPRDKAKLLAWGKGKLQVDSVVMENLNEFKLIKTEDGVKVYQNPSRSDVKTLLDKFSVLRGTSFEDKIYIWNAYKATHHDIIDVISGFGDYGTDYFDFILADSPAHDDEFSEWNSTHEIAPGIWGEFYGEDSYKATKTPMFKRMLPKQLNERPFSKPQGLEGKSTKELQAMLDDEQENPWHVNGSERQGRIRRALDKKQAVSERTEFPKQTHDPRVIKLARYLVSKISDGANFEKASKILRDQILKISITPAIEQSLLTVGLDLLYNQELAKKSITEKEETLELPDLNIGDELKIGRWKNKKAEIKGFKKDKNNHPIAKTTKGDVQIFKPRVTKLMPEKK